MRPKLPAAGGFAYASSESPYHLSLQLRPPAGGVSPTALVMAVTGIASPLLTCSRHLTSSAQFFGHLAHPPLIPLRVRLAFLMLVAIFSVRSAEVPLASQFIRAAVAAALVLLSNFRFRTLRAP